LSDLKGAEPQNQQNINSKDWQNSGQPNNISNNNKTISPDDSMSQEKIPHLSEKEQTALNEKRNSSDFQQNLQNILPKENLTKNQNPSDLTSTVTEWMNDDEQNKKTKNNTGLPDNLKSGIENLSGYSMDDVNVHYNSSSPKELGALAYAQNTDIHLAPGQEKHLDHEAWHVAQQKQGRVNSTLQMKGGVNINDNKGLEKEADVMGAKASKMNPKDNKNTAQLKKTNSGASKPVAQRLALQYGNDAPIPQDAVKIAEAQDDDRGQDIAVQQIPGLIQQPVFTNMGDNEKIFIVAHGRAPIGNEPAILQEGRGAGTLTGPDIAAIINQIKTGLALEGKSLGDVKIEACMSALGRKTKRQGILGETFVKKKPSLIKDVEKSLKSTYRVKDVTLEGNLGFSTGNEFDEEGVSNLSPANTELGLLVSVVEKLLDVDANDWASNDNKALKKDGLNIIKKYGTELEAFDANTQVGQLLPDPTGTYLNLLLTIEQKPEKRIINNLYSVLNLLSGYIRENN